MTTEYKSYRIYCNGCQHVLVHWTRGWSDFNTPEAAIEQAKKQGWNLSSLPIGDNGQMVARHLCDVCAKRREQIEQALEAADKFTEQYVDLPCQEVDTEP